MELNINETKKKRDQLSSHNRLISQSLSIKNDNKSILPEQEIDNANEAIVNNLKICNNDAICNSDNQENTECNNYAHVQRTTRNQIQKLTKDFEVKTDLSYVTIPDLSDSELSEQLSNFSAEYNDNLEMLSKPENNPLFGILASETKKKNVSRCKLFTTINEYNVCIQSNKSKQIEKGVQTETSQTYTNKLFSMLNNLSHSLISQSAPPNISTSDQTKTITRSDGNKSSFNSKIFSHSSESSRNENKTNLKLNTNFLASKQFNKESSPHDVKKIDDDKITYADIYVMNQRIDEEDIYKPNKFMSTKYTQSHQQKDYYQTSESVDTIDYKLIYTPSLSNLKQIKKFNLPN